MSDYMPVLQLNRPPRPHTAKRYRALYVTRQEGNFIKYKLSQAGWTVTAVADVTGVGHGDVSNVLAGRRHSKTVEAKVASILGYASWNDMVLAIKALMAA